jgi:hypothetical protein
MSCKQLGDRNEPADCGGLTASAALGERLREAPRLLHPGFTQRQRAVQRPRFARFIVWEPIEDSLYGPLHVSRNRNAMLRSRHVELSAVDMLAS